MPTPALGQFSPTKTRRVVTIAASLLAVMGLTFIAISWGSIMSSIESPNSAKGGDAEQQAYDPSLLKVLSQPSRPATAPPAPGLRKIVVQDLSLRGAAPTAPGGQELNYEITFDTSQ